MYEQVRDEELEAQIRSIELAHGAQKYGEAWKTVNDMTGRKRSKEGQVIGASPYERVNTWFTHFQKLLGNPPEVHDLEEEIPTIFEDIWRLMMVYSPCGNMEKLKPP